MKTILKTLILSTTILAAHLAIADNKKESKKSEATSEKELLINQVQETEHQLLQEYFKSLEMSNFEFKGDSAISIYTSEGACVYQGEKSSANDLLNKSAFLFAFDNEEHYVIAE